MNENGAGRTTAKQGGSRSGRAGALPPVELIRRSDIAAALDAAQQKSVLHDGDWSFDGTASTEEENRLRILARLTNDPRRTRPALVADAATVTRLDKLARTAANMARPLALVRSLAALSAATGRPLRVPPLLLLGPPGTGKTRIATKLAAALETGELVLNGTSINDDHAWMGPRIPGAGAEPVGSLKPCWRVRPLDP